MAIRAVFVHGSVAKSTHRAASDVDLMIIGDALSHDDVLGAVERVPETWAGV